jgi:hypothetical protein
MNNAHEETINAFQDNKKLREEYPTHTSLSLLPLTYSLFSAREEKREGKEGG